MPDTNVCTIWVVRNPELDSDCKTASPREAPQAQKEFFKKFSGARSTCEVWGLGFRGLG